MFYTSLYRKTQNSPVNPRLKMMLKAANNADPLVFKMIGSFSRLSILNSEKKLAKILTVFQGLQFDFVSKQGYGAFDWPPFFFFVLFDLNKVSKEVKPVNNISDIPSSL